MDNCVAAYDMHYLFMSTGAGPDFSTQVNSSQHKNATYENKRETRRVLATILRM